MANWFFLAQPAPLPDRVIAAADDVYVNPILDALNVPRNRQASW